METITKCRRTTENIIWVLGETGMDNTSLKSIQQIIKELAEKYSIPYEIVEGIIKDYINIQCYALTGREIDERDLFNF